MGGRTIWLLLDEWSSVSPDLQPYLADLIRRALFPVPDIAVKIAAIEKRSRFKINLENGDYVGIELGGDASADLNMDDYMVFDNDEDKAVAFFAALIYKHASLLAEREAVDVGNSPAELVSKAFTQENVFREFVRAAEGIPRDAFNILSLAAQRDFGASFRWTISVGQLVCGTSGTKETAVAANQEALEMLHWVVDDVIATEGQGPSCSSEE